MAEMKIRDVYLALAEADQELEKKYPFLKHQDTIGFCIFAGSIIGMLGLAYAYAIGAVSGWVALIGNALFASLLHELEHDLIHTQYFKASRFMQNLMYFGIWIFNGNTVNPWYRKKLHLLHHKESGQPEDIEERLLGNGMPWGLKRLLLTLDNTYISVFRLKPLSKEVEDFRVKELLRARFPLGIIYTFTWLSFLILSVLTFVSGQSHFGQGYGAFVWFMMVTLVGPNMIRQATLSFISANCHYYGIDRMKIVQQTQILNHWIFWPVQIFCFNFGSTHVIHHFYVPQTFYRRQMIVARAHQILLSAGVRQNDLKSILHANSWDALAKEERPESVDEVAPETDSEMRTA